MKRFIFAALVALTVAFAAPAHAAVTSGYGYGWGGSWQGNAALNWAEEHALGHWYAWAGTGPSYDCSGLVMESVGHATGIWLPHSSYLMVHNPHMHRIALSSARRGDVLVWGSPTSPYHVEFATAWAWTSFGAHHSGTRIGWSSYFYFRPSGAYRVY